MAKNSIESAISILKAEKDDLTPSQKQELSELAAAGEDVRSDVSESLSTSKAAIAARLVKEGHKIAAAMGNSPSRKERESTSE